MSARHYGHQGKADANTKAIVEKLRAHKDIRVRFWGKPVDLVVGYGGANYLIEIKNEDGKDMRGPSWETQKKFIEDWTGQVCVCKTYEAVLHAIGHDKRPV